MKGQLVMASNPHSPVPAVITPATVSALFRPRPAASPQPPAGVVDGVLDHRAPRAHGIIMISNSAEITEDERRELGISLSLANVPTLVVDGSLWWIHQVRDPQTHLTTTILATSRRPVTEEVRAAMQVRLEGTFAVPAIVVDGSRWSVSRVHTAPSHPPIAQPLTEPEPALVLNLPPTSPENAS